MEKGIVFFLSESESYDEDFGFAFSPDNIDPLEIQNWNINIPWIPIVFKLDCGKFPDYLINDLSIPLCSSKLYDVIHKYARNKDNILFYSTVVSNGVEDKTYYYFKIIKVAQDIIDIEKSKKINNVIMHPFFISEKIEDVFRCDYDISYLFVSKYLKQKLEENEITGLSYESW